MSFPYFRVYRPVSFIQRVLLFGDLHDRDDAPSGDGGERPEVRSPRPTPHRGGTNDVDGRHLRRAQNCLVTSLDAKAIVDIYRIIDLYRYQIHLISMVVKVYNHIDTFFPYPLGLV